MDILPILDALRALDPVHYLVILALQYVLRKLDERIAALETYVETLKNTKQ